MLIKSLNVITRSANKVNVNPFVDVDTAKLITCEPVLTYNNTEKWADLSVVVG